MTIYLHTTPDYLR